MMSERTRMYKERAEIERKEEEQKQRDREAMGEMFMNFMLFIGAIAVVIPFSAIMWQVFVLR